MFGHDSKIDLRFFRLPTPSTQTFLPSFIVLLFFLLYFFFDKFTFCFYIYFLLFPLKFIFENFVYFAFYILYLFGTINVKYSFSLLSPFFDQPQSCRLSSSKVKHNKLIFCNPCNPQTSERCRQSVHVNEATSLSNPDPITRNLSWL